VFPLTQGTVERRFDRVPWGLADRVRDRLRASPGVVVAGGYPTARAIFESGGGFDSAARLLGAEYVVHGSVSPAGALTEVEITVSSVSRKRAILRGRFQLPRYSLQYIEDDVVGHVARLVGGPRATPAAPLGSAASTPDHDFMVLRAAVMEREPGLAAADSARQQLEEVFAADTSAGIAARLAGTYAVLLDRKGHIPDAERLALLRRLDALLGYVQRGDSSRADLWTLRAVAARHRTSANVASALPFHRRAVQLNPRSAHAEYEYGVTLSQLGRDAEAAPHLRRAAELEPGHAPALAVLAEIELRAGRAAAACAMINASIAADPFEPRAYGTRALARLRLAQAREAYADAEVAQRLVSSLWPVALRVRIDHAASNVNGARAGARALAARYLVGTVEYAVEDAVALAATFAEMGMTKDAMGALGRARPVGQRLAAALRDSAFDSVRKDSAFAALERTARGK
jgi:tetratricopeptide (TPR) repeat protein